MTCRKDEKQKEAEKLSQYFFPSTSLALPWTMERYKVESILSWKTISTSQRSMPLSAWPWEVTYPHCLNFPMCESTNYNLFLESRAINFSKWLDTGNRTKTAIKISFKWLKQSTATIFWTLPMCLSLCLALYINALFIP